MSNKIDSTTCLYLDSLWNQAMRNGELLSAVPVSALKLLRSSVMAIHNTILNSAYIVLDSLENSASKFEISTESDPKDKSKEKLCKMVFQCKAALEYLIPKDTTKESIMTKSLIPDSKVRNTIRDYLYNNGPVDSSFDMFETFYCKLSMSYSLESLLSDMAMGILASLYELLRKIKPVISMIDNAINSYMTAIKPFLEFMDGLDKFGECALASCDYATTSKNYKDDQSQKLYIQKTNDTWVFTGIEWIDKVYTEYNDLENRINSTKSKMEQWVKNNCDENINKKANSLSATTGSYGKIHI